jgi:hypothetical protein
MSCGSSCWPYDIDYNFDARTGRRLWLYDFLTPKTLKLTKVSFSKQLVVAAKQFEAKLEEENTKKHVNWREIELLPEIAVVSKESIDWSPEFVIRDNKLSIFGCKDYKCYNRFEYSVDMNAPDSTLTEYGKYIFSGGQEAYPEKRNPFDQMLHGHIGNSSITMRLHRPLEVLKGEVPDFPGYYFYDKYRKIIFVDGTLKGTNQIELKEMQNGDRQATMTLKIEGETLSGKWIGKNKILNMEVTSF